MVKSVSSSDALPTSVPPQVHESEMVSNSDARGGTELVMDIPDDLLPQAQVLPAGLEFSSLEREQLHAPAGRWSM